MKSYGRRSFMRARSISQIAPDLVRYQVAPGIVSCKVNSNARTEQRFDFEKDILSGYRYS